jgi:tryptophanyl-tRNA synthetase
MAIETDSTPLEEPKNTETCCVFAIYKLLADENEILTMVENYKNVNRDFGYGHAKQALFELMITKFKTEREKYNYYMNNQSAIDEALELGAKKAKIVAGEVLKRVRDKLGF